MDESQIMNDERGRPSKMELEGFAELSYERERSPAELLESARKEYHHAELYDPNKSYESEKFLRDFGPSKNGIERGERQYQWGIMVTDKSKNLGVVFAQEVLSPEDMRLLEPFCDCARHKAFFLTKPLHCSCCSGCLDSFFPPPQFRIDRARERLRAKLESPHSEPTSWTNCLIC